MPNTGGSTFLSTVDHEFAWVVSNSFTCDGSNRTVVLTLAPCNHAEQYALTEASYTLVKLMLHFDMLENADPPIRMEPLLQSNLNMSHDSGVFVRLYSSKRQ